MIDIFHCNLVAVGVVGKREAEEREKDVVLKGQAAAPAVVVYVFAFMFVAENPAENGGGVDVVDVVVLAFQKNPVCGFVCPFVCTFGLGVGEFPKNTKGAG